jgi:HEAT repeat protein
MCLQALANIRNPDVAPDVADIIDQEKDEAIQWEGLQVLGALQNPQSIDAIRKYIDHSSVQMRKHSVFNLGALRNPEATEDIKKKLSDESIEVRWNAAFALAYFLKDKTGVPILLSMIDRDQVGRAVDPKDAFRDLFINNIMTLAARALGVLREKSAEPHLQKLAENDPSPEVRTECRNALKQIQQQ